MSKRSHPPQDPFKDGQGWKRQNIDGIPTQPQRRPIGWSSPPQQQRRPIGRSSPPPQQQRPIGRSSQRPIVRRPTVICPPRTSLTSNDPRKLKKDIKSMIEKNNKEIKSHAIPIPRMRFLEEVNRCLVKLIDYTTFASATREPKNHGNTMLLDNLKIYHKGMMQDEGLWAILTDAEIECNDEIKMKFDAIHKETERIVARALQERDGPFESPHNTPPLQRRDGSMFGPPRPGPGFGLPPPPQNRKPKMCDTLRESHNPEDLYNYVTPEKEKYDNAPNIELQDYYLARVYSRLCTLQRYAASAMEIERATIHRTTTGKLDNARFDEVDKNYKEIMETPKFFDDLVLYGAECDDKVKNNVNAIHEYIHTLNPPKMCETLNRDSPSPLYLYKYITRELEKIESPVQRKQHSSLYEYLKILQQYTVSANQMITISTNKGASFKSFETPGNDGLVGFDALYNEIMNNKMLWKCLEDYEIECDDAVKKNVKAIHKNIHAQTKV